MWNRKKRLLEHIIISLAVPKLYLTYIITTLNIIPSEIFFFLSISTSKILFFSKDEWVRMVPIVKKIRLPVVFSCEYMRRFNALHLFLFIIILTSDHFNNFRLKFPIVCSKFFFKKKSFSIQIPLKSSEYL